MGNYENSYVLGSMKESLTESTANRQIEDVLLLSIILNNNKRILDLSEGDFNFDDTKYIFNRVSDLHKNGLEVTITSVADGKNTLLAYLAGIENNKFMTWDIGGQIDELRKYNRVRDTARVARFLEENKEFPNALEEAEDLIKAINRPKSQKLVSLASVTTSKEKVEKYKSFIQGIDTAINGFQMGQLSVWTGQPGHGKSTFISQMLIEAVEQGYNVCSYSGELKLENFKNWVDLQCAGDANIKLVNDYEYNRRQATMSGEVLDKIHDWYSGKIYCYDNRLVYENVESNFVTNVIEEAITRYNCKVFLIDNLMTCSFENTSQENYYKAQSDFAAKLSYIAKSRNVHIHLVAHLRKAQGEIKLDDISGTGDTGKRADNVFNVIRNDDDTTTVRVMKCRETGENGVDVNCSFLPNSKRFYQTDKDMSKYRKYGWERATII